MQVTTGNGIVENRVFLKITTMLIIGLVLISIVLILFYKDSEISDLKNIKFDIHTRIQKTIKLVEGESLENSNLNFILMQLNNTFPEETIQLYKKKTLYKEIKNSRNKIETDFFNDESIEKHIRYVDPNLNYIVSNFKVELVNEKIDIKIITNISNNINELNNRIIKIGIITFIVEFLIVLIFLYLAKRGDENLIKSQHEQIVMENELFFLSHYDTVTHLPNKSLFWERLDAAIIRSYRLGKGINLIKFEVEDLRSIISDYGHSTGDKILAEIARRLQSSARSIDLVCRLSADEFCILQEDLDTDSALDLIKITCDKYKTLEKNTINDGVNNIKIKTTISFAIYPLNGGTGEELLKYVQRKINTI